MASAESRKKLLREKKVSGKKTEYEARAGELHTRSRRQNPQMVPTSPVSVLPPISPEHGKCAGSPEALKQAGNEAVRLGEWQRAAHMFTLAIDMILGDTTPTTAAEWFAADADSKGMLHLLCSNRSLAHLSLQDSAAAADDAEHCCLARPDFVKGHLRLLAALRLGDAPVQEQIDACSRGLRACPHSRDLQAARGALGGGQEPADSGEEAAALLSQLAETRRIADDPKDARRFMAAGDYGAALVLGAHGVEQNRELGEIYLRRGADGGDSGAQRNCGMLLLESDRAAEAAEYLRQAADQGDEEAAATLLALGKEAEHKREQAVFKLRALASAGDERARAMLTEMGM